MKTEKSIFEKKYITEAQARAAANKAGVADIEKVGSVWMMVSAAKVSKAAKAAAKPAKESKPKAAAKPASKPASKPKAAAKPAPAPEPVEEKNLGGRPLSPAAAKIRKRVLVQLGKQAEAGQPMVTVKEMTKSTKMQKMHVSNQIRWAEDQGLIKREGYKIKPAGTPGRKEVLYSIVPEKVAEAVAAA